MLVWRGRAAQQTRSLLCATPGPPLEVLLGAGERVDTHFPSFCSTTTHYLPLAFMEVEPGHAEPPASWELRVQTEARTDESLAAGQSSDSAASSGNSDGAVSLPGPKSPMASSPAKGKSRILLLHASSGAKTDERMIVSDSEEERQRRVKARRPVLVDVDVNEFPVIEISSDEEDEDDASLVACKATSQPRERCKESRGYTDGNDADEVLPVTPRGKRKALRTPRTRGIIVSSDDEDDRAGCPKQLAAGPPLTTPVARRKSPLDDDIIDLTVSSPEPEEPQSRPGSRSPMVEEDGRSKAQPSEDDADVDIERRPRSDDEAEKVIPLFVDDDSDDDATPDDPFALDDGSILVLDEPRSARKPIKKVAQPRKGATASPFTPLRQAHTAEDLEEGDSSPVKPQTTRTTLVSNARPAVPSPVPGKAKAKAPRMTKKMLLEAELQRRRAYASAFFEEMNDTAFGGGLPENTELVWSKRMLTTAGRAHWRKDGDGSHTTSIQLAEKVLDSDERIRNTLSHEMCHLACWIISNAPDEQHGAIFKGWARKVMRKRSDVEITTKHDYEIVHKYQWKCENCSKIYGRHSKSIDPEQHVCGVCQGRLVPQFTTRAPRTPKPKADSQNAAARSRDSPLVMPGTFPASPAIQTTESTRSNIELSDGEESEIEILAHTFKGVQIN
ncbi:SprT-like family-domain-containing protein [Trametes maxima]|nr:SprT-like family-domain-containing protein [Trametes maxima]